MHKKSEHKKEHEHKGMKKEHHSHGEMAIKAKMARDGGKKHPRGK